MTRTPLADSRQIHSGVTKPWWACCGQSIHRATAAATLSTHFASARSGIGVGTSDTHTRYGHQPRVLLRKTRWAYNVLLDFLHLMVNVVKCSTLVAAVIVDRHVVFLS